MADVEIETIKQLLDLLRPFDSATRSRMWRWVSTRLDADQQEAALLSHMEKSDG